MARIKVNAGTKRTRLKGVRKKVRNSNAKPNYKMNTNHKVGPKVRNFNGDVIGHAERVVTFVTDAEGKRKELVSSRTVFTPEALKTIKEIYAS